MLAEICFGVLVVVGVVAILFNYRMNLLQSNVSLLIQINDCQSAQILMLQIQTKHVLERVS